ncbi:hypothetical protein [Vibrio crassostreae]|uniref:hypothetical protein n=1 Tax=Vibrio crassostreae TaxID=246167 RepID=UPI001BD4FC53|nr:hypothetical protein [Vibrio crassostreae]
MLNIEKAASYEVLLHVQGIVREENTRHPLALALRMSYRLKPATSVLLTEY